MFDRIFQHPHALARQCNGPLAEERRRFLVHCAEQQLSTWTLREIAYYTLTVAKALRLADRPGELIPRNEIEAEADRWVSRRIRPPVMHKGCTRLRFMRHATRWLAFLGRVQPSATVQRPYADHVAEFTEYLRCERGFSPNTIAYRDWTVQAFLTRIDEAGLRLDSLTVSQLDELILKKLGNEGYARKTIQGWVTNLRSFFRFAEGRGWCRPGLAAAMRAPRVVSLEGLPVGPSWEDVNRLLAAALKDRPVDIRDRALLMLLAIYGLRSGEVTALRLDDFDWEQELLTVSHGKGQRTRIYPLCRSVGDAVLRYLQEVRPRSDRREVFLTLKAPFRRLLSGSLGAVVSRRLHALGLTLPHYGSHALRHACATHLLAQGLSLKEIGDHLGHRLPQTTRIYAKVDLAALRMVGDFALEGLL